MEGLAPDLDWWFGQAPAETAAETDVETLCSELAKIFAARHADERLSRAFPELPESATNAELQLGTNARAGLAKLTGYGRLGDFEGQPISMLLQFAVSDLCTAHGVGDAAATQVVNKLIELSIVVRVDKSEQGIISSVAGAGSAYACSSLKSIGVPADLDRVRSRVVSGAIDEAIAYVVSAEGPIAIDKLARLVVQGFGFERTTLRRSAQVIRRVPRKLVRRSRLGTFVWPGNVDPETWRGYRVTPPGVNRPLDEVAPEEVANAMHALAGAPLSRSELYHATLAVFDRDRLTKQATELLDACLTSLLREGRIQSNGLVYRAVDESNIHNPASTN